jgi:hypothetical protein
MTVQLGTEEEGEVLGVVKKPGPAPLELTLGVAFQLIVVLVEQRTLPPQPLASW